MARTQQKQKRLRRGSKNTQKNYTRKFLMTQITTMVWSFTQGQTFWSVKLSGSQEALPGTKLVEVMEFQPSYFKSQTMMLLKCCTQLCPQIWKTQQWPQNWKRSVFIPIPKKGNAQECLNYCTIALISHAGKGMLKILHVRLQLYMN